jgi:hypothetical protein
MEPNLRPLIADADTLAGILDDDEAAARRRTAEEMGGGGAAHYPKSGPIWPLIQVNVGRR